MLKKKLFRLSRSYVTSKASRLLGNCAQLVFLLPSFSILPPPTTSHSLLTVVEPTLPQHSCCLCTPEPRPHLGIFVHAVPSTPNALPMTVSLLPSGLLKGPSSTTLTSACSSSQHIPGVAVIVIAHLCVVHLPQKEGA